MIKKIAFVVAVSLFGIAFVSLINLFITGTCQTNPGACIFPYCEDCDAGGGRGTWLLGSLITVLLYGVIAFVITKKKLRKNWAMLVLGVYSVCVAFVAETSYLYLLIKHSDSLFEAREIQADGEYMPPVLAKEEIQAFEKGDSLKPLFVIKQWERCALGYEEEEDTMISINCKKGVGWIKKSDINKLIKVPM